MKRGICLSVLFAIVVIACDVPTPNQRPGKSGTTATSAAASWPASAPASVPVNAESLANTIVTVDIDEPLEPGKNVLWCASMQLAWNELMDASGGGIIVGDGQRNRSAVALNGQWIEKKDVGDDDSVTFFGAPTSQALSSLRGEIAAKFGQGVEPRLLYPPPGTILMMYAMLYKDMPFAKPFNRLSPQPFFVGGDRTKKPVSVACFGLEPLDHFSLKDVAKQVSVIWYDRKVTKNGDAKQRFVLELLTRKTGDRLILAKITPGDTLKDVVRETLAFLSEPNTLEEKDLENHRLMRALGHDLSLFRCLMKEPVRIPVLNVELFKDYPELCGRTLKTSKGPMDGLAFDWVKQYVKFRLDEKGALLHSEASGGIFGGPEYVRDFSFDEPFLVMIIKKDATKPCFALWVANDELMVHEKVSQETEERWETSTQSFSEQDESEQTENDSEASQQTESAPAEVWED